MKGVARFFGAKTLMPNAALSTLMALTPGDVSVEYMLCDENVTRLDWEQPYDLVAVTGTVLTARRMEEICRGFDSRGIPVAIGGPYATLEAEACQGLADFHFIGEAEHTWPRFLRQWAQGRSVEPTHVQETFVDLRHSPAPDWSLISAGDYLQVGVQSSRGCPNRCDFCDVMPFVGGRLRTKAIEQVLQEVDNVQDLGVRSVFLSDDNFAANRQRAKALLEVLIRRPNPQQIPLSFSTQATLSLADDEELLRLLADAQFRILFIGLETIREQGLREANKAPNLSGDLVERLGRIAQYGLVAVLGVIVGFDADDEAIFDELHQFIEETDSLLVGSGLLNAPPGTPLHARLEQEGRLDGSRFSGELQMASNVLFKNFDGDTLARKNMEFLQRIYQPELFGRRLERWISRVNTFSEHSPYLQEDSRQFIRRAADIFLFAKRHFNGPQSAMLRRVMKQGLRQEPRLMPAIVEILAQYWHFYSFVSGTAQV